MIAALLLALAFAAGNAPIDEVIEVPAGEWRDVVFALRRQSAVFECRFDVVSGRSGVRLALLPASELDRMRANQRHRVLVTTGFDREGSFRVPVEAGEYALVIDNRLDQRQPARVHFAVAIEFAPPAGQPRELTPARRFTVIAVSLAIFLATLAYALPKLRRRL